MVPDYADDDDGVEAVEAFHRAIAICQQIRDHAAGRRWTPFELKASLGLRPIDPVPRVDLYCTKHLCRAIMLRFLLSAEGGRNARITAKGESQSLADIVDACEVVARKSFIDEVADARIAADDDNRFHSAVLAFSEMHKIPGCPHFARSEHGYIRFIVCGSEYERALLKRVFPDERIEIRRYV